MAWIEYHESLRDHWKVHRLAEKLKVDYTAALGHLSCLWLWAVSNAPSGYLKGFSNNEICRAMVMKKMHFDIKKDLLECGLLDKNFKIHDWHKHGVSYLESHRKAQSRYRNKKHNGDITVTSQLTINQPDQTRPDQPIYNGKQFFEKLRENKAYQFINIDSELSKMDAWLLANKGRKKTKRFIVNWLNRAVDKNQEVFVDGRPTARDSKPHPLANT